MVTHVVWDWNGTLLDDLHCCIDVTNTLLTEYGLPVLDDGAAYQRVFRFPVASWMAYCTVGSACRAMPRRSRLV